MAKQPEWKRRILLPIWFIRICAMIFIIIVMGLAISVVRHSYGDLPGLGIVVLYFLFIIAVLLMDVLQILMLLRGNLSAATLLIMNSAQTGFWGAVIIMDVKYIVKDGGNVVGIAFTAALFLLFLSLLIYAAVVYHRERKGAQRGVYAPAHNPAMPAAIPTPYTGPAIDHHNTAYHSPMHHGGDLGQQPMPYSSHGAAADYYTQQPTKPANMV